MKRKISAPNSRDPPRTRIPSGRGFHAIRSSDFPIARPPRTSDSRDDENQLRTTRCEIEGADNAKTSEYAFFKKLKEGASNTAQSYPLRNEACETKNSKSRDCSRERINMTQCKRGDVRTSFHNKNATPEFNARTACEILENVNRKQDGMVEEYGSVLRMKGNSLTLFEETEAENRHADIFDRKRRKLRQWVAETSFPEIDELCSKGYDFVFVLLSRLVPNCNENNKLKDRELVQAETNGKSMSLPFYESDINFKKLQWTPTRNFMELECGPCLHDTIPSCWPNASRERVFCSDSPTSYASKNDLQYRVWELDFELPGGSAISYTKSHSQYVLPFNGYGLATSEHVEEMDVSQPNEYFVERELSVPMLGWDYGSTKEDRNLCNLSRYRAEQTSASSASYHGHDILRHGREGNDDILSGFHQFPLALSCIPNFIDLAEECIDETACEVGSNIFSLQNDYWFKSKVINEDHYLSKISSLLLTHNEDKHERSLLDNSSHTRSLAHFNEDDVSTHDRSPFWPQISLDREKAISWPLLLGDSNWDGSVREEF